MYLKAELLKNSYLGTVMNNYVILRFVYMQYFSAAHRSVAAFYTFPVVLKGRPVLTENRLPHLLVQENLEF